MDERRVRKIIRIDMEAFYSSFEQRDNQDLKSRPVAFGCSASFGHKSAAAMAA
jgi:DNA polymerase-4